MKNLQIDIVSDVVCPWCAIGYGNLTQALEQLTSVQANVQWHPFQLNPYMGKEGQDINEHISEKYGLTDKQMEDNKQNIKAMGKKAGFDISFDKRARIYNTLDCHILLHFAQEKGKQTELKLALFKAYFTDGKDVSDRAVLIDAVESVSLDKQEAEIALDSEHYKKTVQDEESKFKSMGISSVPAFIINNKYLLSGGQPVENFIQSLTEIAEKEA
ncbi:MAG: putative DsbA family dithiol-disulfide isomerase [Psychrobacter glaciei]|jgi:predicted DsbA family dithiol-disulfide isomerase